MSLELTRRPSAFETIFWHTTRISPARQLEIIPRPSREQISWPRSSPGLTIGIPSIAVSVIDAHRQVQPTTPQARAEPLPPDAPHVLGSGHDCVGGDRAHPELFDRSRRARGRHCRERKPRDIAIEARDAKRARLRWPKPAQHLVGGTFDRLAADDRADGGDSRTRAAQRLAHAAQREDRADRDERIRRREDDGVRVANRVERRGSGRARDAPRNSILLDGAARASAHEIFLERNRGAPAQFHEGAHRDRRSSAGLARSTPKRRAISVGDAAKRRAGAHPLGADTDAWRGRDRQD